MTTAEGGSPPAAGQYLPPAPAPWTFNGGMPSDHFRFVQAAGALIYYRPSSPGEAAAPGMVEAVGKAWRRLAGPGTKTHGVEIFLSDPFVDPSSGEVVSQGTVVDEQRRQIWMAVTDEARPESPERPLALILGTDLPDCQELGFLLEGCGLAVSDMPDPDPHLRQAQLPALAEATGPLRNAMACSFVRFLLTAKDTSTFVRLLTTTPPGGLSAACEQLYDAPLAELDQRWRRQLYFGREGPEVVSIEREARLRDELEAERAARAGAEQALQAIEQEWHGRQELSERQLAEARLELERAEQEVASEHEQRAAAEQQLERVLKSESQLRADLEAAREELNEWAETTGGIERALGEAHAELNVERSARAQAQESAEVAQRERRAQQERFERELAEARRGLQRAREETASEREQRADLNRQLAQLVQAERYLHDELAEAHLELEATRGELAEAADELDQTRAQLRERAVAAGELERALDGTRQELGQVKQALAEAEERLTARSAELRDERASRLESERELDRLGTRLDQVTAALTAAEAELAAANERGEQERKMRHELEQQTQTSLQRLQGELEEARGTASAEAASAATAMQRLLTTRRELEREHHARVNAEGHLKRALSELRRRSARANEMLSHARAETAHEQRRVEIAQRELEEVRTKLAHERGDRASLELNGDGRRSQDMAPEPQLDSQEHNLAQVHGAEDEEAGTGDLDSASADTALRGRKSGIFRRNASRRKGV